MAFAQLWWKNSIETTGHSITIIAYVVWVCRSFSLDQKVCC